MTDLLVLESYLFQVAENGGQEGYVEFMKVGRLKVLGLHVDDAPDHLNVLFPQGVLLIILEEDVHCLDEVLFTHLCEIDMDDRVKLRSPILSIICGIKFAGELFEVGLDIYELVDVDERVLVVQVIQVYFLVVNVVDQLIRQLPVLAYVYLDARSFALPLLVHHIQLVHP